MREILFRGKRENNGEWVEGFYVARSNKTWIYPAENQIISKSLARELRPFHSASSTQKLLREVFPVDPDTVGQYTGLMDKNGKRIFEDDICRVCLDPEICISHIQHDQRIASFIMRHKSKEFSTFLDMWFAKQRVGDNVWIEVIGNIHDNPELMEEKNNE